MTDSSPRDGDRPGLVGDCAAVPIAESRATRVLIVEDSSIVRQRLVEMLGALPGVAVVGQAVDGHEALAHFWRERPDAVILDLSLPGMSGLELLTMFKRGRPQCVVMVLTTYAFDALRERCAQLGADHFFDKASEFERVTDVLGAGPATVGLEGRS